MIKNDLNKENMINLIAFFFNFSYEENTSKVDLVIKLCNIFFNSWLKYQYWITMKFRVSYMWECTDTILQSDSSLRCPIFLSKFMVKAVFLPSFLPSFIMSSSVTSRKLLGICYYPNFRNFQETFRRLF